MKNRGPVGVSADVANASWLVRGRPVSRKDTEGILHLLKIDNMPSREWPTK
jgi:hypothetical protein